MFKDLDSSTFLPVNGRTKTLNGRFKVSVANHSNSESRKTNSQSKSQVLLEKPFKQNVLKQKCLFQSVLMLVLEHNINFLSDTWLLHNQFWATVEGAASLTRC